MSWYEAVAFSFYIGLPPKVAYVSAVLQSTAIKQLAIINDDMLVAKIKYSYSSATISQLTYPNLHIVLCIQALCLTTENILINSINLVVAEQRKCEVVYL